MLRRGYVFLPLIVLLGLSAAVLGVVYGLNAAVPPSGGALPKTKWGPTIGLPVVALYFVWQAGVFAEKRSVRSANLMFGFILLLANIALGVNVYRVLNGIPAPTVARRGGSSNTPTTTAPAPSFSPSLPVAPAPQPVTQSAPSTTPAGPVPAPLRVPAQPPPPAPPQGPSPHEVAEQQATARAAPVIESFHASLLEDLKSAADAAAGFAQDISKPPTHDKRVLKERNGNAEALRNHLVKLESRLKAASDDLEKELKAAGLDEFDARHRAMRADGGFSTSSRAFAAARLIDLCDRVKKECAVLDQNFAAWAFIRGEITVRDPKKRHELTTERFFIEADTKNLDSTLTTLREGR